MKKALGELEDIATEVYLHIKNLHSEKIRLDISFDMPKYIDVDNIRFYFPDDRATLIVPLLNIGKEPIALDATLEK